MNLAKKDHVHNFLSEDQPFPLPISLLATFKNHQGYIFLLLTLTHVFRPYQPLCYYYFTLEDMESSSLWKVF